MKKIILFLLLICLIFITSCKENNKEPKVSLEVIASTIKDVYYIDEFNITTIKLQIEKGEEKIEESLTPLMIENYPSSFEEGIYTFIVCYEGEKVEFSVNFIERETYTEGLEFSLNKSNDSYVVSGYKGIEKEVIIPSTFNYLPVKLIKAYAFDNNKLIKKVLLPNTIIEIEANAFSNSTLKEINIPDSCEKIGDAAFYGCQGLRSITLKKSIKSLGDYSFNNTFLIYTDSTDTSGWNVNAFDNNLVYIYEGLDLTKIVKENDFEYYISDNAMLLNYSGELNKVEIPLTINNYLVTKIGNSAFLKLETLEEVIIGQNVTLIGDKAFRETGLTHVEIPSSVKEIGVYSFSGCESLEEVIFNEGLETIKMSAFAACNHLLVAILPNSLKTIEQYGFQNCLKIKTIYIPKNVSYIGDYTFYACHYATLYIEAESIPSSWHSNFNPSKAKLSFNANKDNI